MRCNKTICKLDSTLAASETPRPSCASESRSAENNQLWRAKCKFPSKITPFLNATFATHGAGENIWPSKNPTPCEGKSKGSIPRLANTARGPENVIWTKFDVSAVTNRMLMKI